MMLQRAASAAPRCIAARTNVSGWRASPVVGSGAGRKCTMFVRSGSEKVTLTESVDDDAAMVSGEYCAIDVTGKKMGKRSVGEMEAVSAPDGGVGSRVGNTRTALHAVRCGRVF